MPVPAVPRIPASIMALIAALVLVSSCGGGEESGFESERPRPTDRSEHDHSGEDSALAPETVLAEDIAALGAGAAVGDVMTVWVGLNVCGRFLEIPGPASSGGLGIDASGLATVAPQEGDDVGHDVTVGDLSELIDVAVGTGELSFGSSWEPQEVTLGQDTVPLAGSSFSTGDSCGEEQGELQLWYYSKAATDSGEEVRMVVTDPQDVPVIESGSAITLAFAPTSSLPTLPPAALVG